MVPVVHGVRVEAPAVGNLLNRQDVNDPIEKVKIETKLGFPMIQ
jgi:hypothetical protein